MDTINHSVKVEANGITFTIPISISIGIGQPVAVEPSKPNTTCANPFKIGDLAKTDIGRLGRVTEVDGYRVHLSFAPGDGLWYYHGRITKVDEVDRHRDRIPSPVANPFKVGDSVFFRGHENIYKVRMIDAHGYIWLEGGITPHHPNLLSLAVQFKIGDRVRPTKEYLHRYPNVKPGTVIQIKDGSLNVDGLWYNVVWYNVVSWELDEPFQVGDTVKANFDGKLYTIREVRTNGYDLWESSRPFGWRRSCWANEIVLIQKGTQDSYQAALNALQPKDNV